MRVSEAHKILFTKHVFNCSRHAEAEAVISDELSPEATKAGELPRKNGTLSF